MTERHDRAPAHLMQEASVDDIKDNAGQADTDALDELVSALNEFSNEQEVVKHAKPRPIEKPAEEQQA